MKMGSREAEEARAAPPSPGHYGSVNPAGAGEGGPPPAYNTGQAPPMYGDVTDPSAPPPSYDSLYGEFRQVQNPTGFFYFIRKASGIVVGTVVAAVVIAVISLIPIAMIVIGSLNVYNCPVERYIPIYLIVGGCFGLLKSLTNFFYRAKRDREHPNAPEDNVNPNPFDGILNCFLLAWFIAGSVWVYRAWGFVRFDSAASPHYCDRLTYYFAFTLITLSYAMMVLFCGFMCCCGWVIVCCRKPTST